MVYIVFVHYFIIIIGATSVAFSVPLTAFTHFMQTFRQGTVTISYFCRTFLGLVVKVSSWLKIKYRGVAIRMSWYAFYEKIVGGGDVYSEMETRDYNNLRLSGDFLLDLELSPTIPILLLFLDVSLNQNTNSFDPILPYFVPKRCRSWTEIFLHCALLIYLCKIIHF